MIAPETAATMTAQSGTIPCEAATPTRITVIDLGMTTTQHDEHTRAWNANTRTTTIQPGSKRMCSGKLPITPSPTPSTFMLSLTSEAEPSPSSHHAHQSAHLALDIAQPERMLLPRSK